MTKAMMAKARSAWQTRRRVVGFMGSKNLSPGFLVAVRVDSGDPMQ
jgi:hypothetical protein